MAMEIVDLATKWWFSSFFYVYQRVPLENRGKLVVFPSSHLLRLHGLDLIGQGRSLRLQGLQPAHAEIVIKNGDS